MRKAEVAVKNAPATGLLNCLVTSRVTTRVLTPATAAPRRFSAPPRATWASWSFEPPPAGFWPSAGAWLPAGALLCAGARPGAGPQFGAGPRSGAGPRFGAGPRSGAGPRPG